MSKNQGIRPGEKAPKSGQYEVIGPRGGHTGKEVTSVKGNVMPPTKSGGAFNLVDPTKNKSGK